MTSLAECFVSMKRIEEFLLLPDENSTETNDHSHWNYALSPDVPREKVAVPTQKMVTINENSLEKSVIFKNVSAKWDAKTQSGIHNLTLEAHENQLIAISGPVASGKSTLLLTILRELDIHSGNLLINGVVSYSAQDPWLFDATIRQNILFTEPFDTNRYLNVIRICGLEHDIRSLPLADLTIVGESGICLSGGQKSRINLARAVYRKADIYLLDDPLSAVDATVGKSIFDNCIKDFLKEKICILVTHQEPYIMASHCAIFMEGGKIHRKIENYAPIKNALPTLNNDNLNEVMKIYL